MRVGPTHPRGASSGVVPPPPSSTGADAAEASGVAATNADVSPLITSDNSDIRCTLDHLNHSDGSWTNFGGHRSESTRLNSSHSRRSRMPSSA